MRQGLVVVKCRIPISGQLVKTFLDVYHEEKLQKLVYDGMSRSKSSYRIVLVKTLILVSGLLCKSRGRQQARGDDGSELHLFGYCERCVCGMY